MSSSKEVRLTLDVSPSFNQKLENLAKKIGTTDKAEVLRRAIALMEVAGDADAKGRPLILKPQKPTSDATAVLGKITSDASLDEISDLFAK